MLDTLRDFVTAHATAIVAVAIFITGGCFGYLLEFGIDGWRRRKRTSRVVLTATGEESTTDELDYRAPKAPDLIPDSVVEGPDAIRIAPYGSEPDPQRRPPTMADLEQFSEHVANDLGDIIAMIQKLRPELTDEDAIMRLLPKLDPGFEWHKLEHTIANEGVQVSRRHPVDASLMVQAGDYCQRITYRAYKSSNVQFEVEPTQEPLMGWYSIQASEKPELFPEQDPPL